MQPRSEEMFYIDENGKQQDAELHNAILNGATIDEKIMAPIRARNRAKYLAAKRA